MVWMQSPGGSRTAPGRSIRRTNPGPILFRLAGRVDFRAAGFMPMLTGLPARFDDAPKSLKVNVLRRLAGKEGGAWRK